MLPTDLVSHPCLKVLQFSQENIRIFYKKERTINTEGNLRFEKFIWNPTTDEDFTAKFVNYTTCPGSYRQLSLRKSVTKSDWDKEHDIYFIHFT